VCPECDDIADVIREKLRFIRIRLGTPVRTLLYFKVLLYVTILLILHLYTSEKSLALLNYFPNQPFNILIFIELKDLSMPPAA
jgi:hypothetical protein